MVKADDPVFRVGFFGFEEAHGDTHPEELGCFHAAWFFAGFVYVEVTVVEGGYSEEVEVEISGGVESIGETIEVVFVEDVLAEAFDFDAVEKVGFEVLAVRFFEGLDTIGLDVPREDFFVNV